MVRNFAKATDFFDEEREIQVKPIVVFKRRMPPTPNQFSKGL